jgi:hypothetical protein
LVRVFNYVTKLSVSLCVFVRRHKLTFENVMGKVNKKG